MNRTLKYLILIASLIPHLGLAHNGSYRTEALSRNIYSLQISNDARRPSYPIFELGTDEFVTLRFDDLAPEINTYSYRIVHCNTDWTPSQLSDVQYISGYTTGYLSDYRTSDNTYLPYTHFEFNFPNESSTCLVSGNYVILVYPDNDNEHPVLSARFMVVENLVGLTTTITAATSKGYKTHYQQLETVISCPRLDIAQPENELCLVIYQNQREDNRVVIKRPTFFAANQVSYKMNDLLVFKAGNEFRTFDISSVRILDRRIKSIDYFKPYYHATLYPDEMRSNRPFESWEDVAGRYICNLQNSQQPETEAEYVFTHFSLPVEGPLLDCDLYLIGELTGFSIDKRGLMRYNPQSNAYETTLLLKQGGYNYQYAAVSRATGKAETSVIEGDFWQTDNEYLLLVYQHPFGSLYDRLVGYQIIYSNSY